MESANPDARLSLVPDEDAATQIEDGEVAGTGIEFNAHRNKIGRAIELRCGIHADRANLTQKGERTSLQFSSVIDIAAHLQAEAPAGGIAVSEPAAALIPGGANAIGSERVTVSGMPGVVWMPRRLVRAEGGTA